jgi:hypothetical protein
MVEYRPRRGARGPAGLHDGGFVVAGSAPDALPILYVGRDEHTCAAAELADLSEDHGSLGRLLGYPPCCVAAYGDARAGGAATEDITARGITDLGPYRRALNPVVRHAYGYRPVFHFPCSLRCERSSALARDHLQLLMRRHVLPAEAADHGAGLALYGPDIGALIVTSFDGDAATTIVPRQVEGRPGDRCPFVPDAAPEIRLRSAFDFSVGPHRYDDGRHFAALFR